MRQRSQALLALFVILILFIGYVFLYDNPVLGQPAYRMVSLGLDLQGGTRVVLQAVEDPETGPVTEEDMVKALSIIRFRVDKLGVSEPVIQRQEGNRILVELAGVEDPGKAAELIGRTAVLKFKGPDGEVIITGDDLIEARAQFNNRNLPAVALELKPEAARRFAEATTRLVGQPISIYLDDELLQAPTVTEPGIEQPEISPYATIEDAQNMAVLLNSGALPVPMEIISNRTVSATLGHDSIQKSRIAGLIGVAAVVLFMIIMYRVPGLVANLALAIYVALVFFTLIAIKAVLTLPGIAGLILSIGMAVDANVIIFERIKEELRAGKTVRSAVDAGFSRAFRTILDANITTIIGAAVLFRFGAGPVKGFALILAIGILASMVTAILVTRYLLRLAIDAGWLNSPKAFFSAGRGR